MADIGTRNSKDGLEAERELRQEMRKREENRRTNEQNEQQDLNQGMSTRTHSSAHSGINWGTSYRMMSKNVEPAAPTRAQIEARAYELYLQRGGQDGHEMENWLSAENELMQQQLKAN